MWTPWLKSPSRLQHTPPSPTRARNRSYSFSCSSFKDIQSLCREEEPEFEPQSPRSPSLFRRVRISTAVLRSWGSRSFSSSTHGPSPQPSVYLPGCEKGIVVYYTSLRVVRRTFEDCRAVRSILQSFGVSMDERDVSMDDSFLGDLQEILGRRNLTLPRVFIGGRYVGGVEDVRQLYESGELNQMIERLPRSYPNSCDSCGGLRFILCDECHGSHKVYIDKSGFKSCTACNVNGLIRCPSCSFVKPRYTK
ncbi:hypothetical protein L6164_029759 [Bauhinia variegata]|uniref:Uncharacterized protein n=1 Tax=Bauhinia variegata TaxID=167791 RepID=A0ACB9LB31_BAUVA|nr:hypothetical protein L6164_029759 [Bauhinia variegata]